MYICEEDDSNRLEMKIWNDIQKRNNVFPQPELRLHFRILGASTFTTRRSSLIWSPLSFHIFTLIIATSPPSLEHGFEETKSDLLQLLRFVNFGQVAETALHEVSHFSSNAERKMDFSTHNLFSAERIPPSNFLVRVPLRQAILVQNRTQCTWCSRLFWYTSSQ